MIESLSEATKRWLESFGWPVVDVDGNLDGRLNHGQVEIQATLTPEMRALVLLHEGAHILFQHDLPTRRYDPSARSRNEVSAENAAVMCARLLGVDLSAASAPYLARFSGTLTDQRTGYVAREMAAHIRAWV